MLFCFQHARQFFATLQLCDFPRPSQHCHTTVPTGLDSAELISQLRAAHAADSATSSGVDVITGGVGDMGKLGIYESFRVRPRGFTHSAGSLCGLKLLSSD